MVIFLAIEQTMNPINTWVVVGFVCVCVALETLAEITLNHWADKTTNHRNKSWMMAVGIALYIGIAVAYAFALKNGSVTVANAWWQCLSLVIITGVGIYLFRDRPTIGQWVGIGVVALGTILLLSGSPELKGSGNTSAWFREWSPLGSEKKASTLI